MSSGNRYKAPAVPGQMGRIHNYLLKATLCAAVVVTGAGCSRQHQAGAFEATGEVIAQGGGDAGVDGACVVCHGLQGQGDGETVPRLAAMDRGYFLQQMENYDNGARNHAQMSWIAGRLDNQARVRLADYYATLPATAPVEVSGVLPPTCPPAFAATLYQQGDPERGLVACATCHGVRGEGVGTGNPPLAGQPAPYVEQQLRLWRTGKRYGDAMHAMTGVSRLLAEDELAPLADYSAALPGATSYPALPATCLPARHPDPRSGA